MRKMIDLLIKHRSAVLTLSAILVAVSLLLATTVDVNYDLASYLPEGSMTKRAITVMEKEFGYPGIADVMVEDVSIPQAMLLKEQLKQITGIKSVLWLDDLTDVTVPESALPSSALASFYKGGAALFKIEFLENDYSLLTGAAIESIRVVVGEGASISGSAEDSRKMRDVLQREILAIILIVFPLCVLILMFASSSWIEPFIYLTVIGISVALNMGTNALFGQISFITHSMASVLQLAISMDYSIFLFHRYIEERDTGADVVEAIKIASQSSLASISASALTTIAGFLALVFMQYRIGTDLGLVLAKGIVLSFVCVMVLMPVLIHVLQKQIDQTRHKPLVPSFHRLGDVVVRLRHVIVPIVAILLVPAFLAQSNNHFLYGDTSGSSGQAASSQTRTKIQERFGVYNPVMLLVPNDSVATEIALADELRHQKHVQDVQALVTVADPQIPRELIPQSVKERFVSDDFSRMIVLVSVDGEKPESFVAVEELNASAERYYPGRWLAAGKATSIADIKTSIEKDGRLVMLFSILSVGAIVLVTFRSLSIPVLLVSVIQASIWLNMSFPYFSDSSLVYIGYLVVSSLQLGATIDYGILLSNRYLEYRVQNTPQQAAVLAIKTAGISVTVSALILAVAGFAEGFISRIPSVSEIGILLGRGAALSGVMVLCALPALLVTFDKFVLRTTVAAKATLRN